VSGEVVSAVSIREEDEAMIITSMGKTIKIDASTVRVLGKGARGVRIVNIDAPDYVIGLDRVVREEIEPALEAAIEPAIELDAVDTEAPGELPEKESDTE